MSWGGLKAQSLCIKRVNILPSSCGFKDVPLSQLLIPCSTSTGKDSSACWFIKSRHYTSNPHFENICNPADTTSELDFQTRCGICTVAPFPHDRPDCWEWKTGENYSSTMLGSDLALVPFLYFQDGLPIGHSGKAGA